MNGDVDIEKLYCCVGKEKHFLIEPVVLKDICGHAACKGCALSLPKYQTITCNVCGKFIDSSLLTMEEVPELESLLKANYDKIIKIVEKTFDETLTKLKSSLKKTIEDTQLQLKNVKDQIDAKVEYVKAEIDRIHEELIDQLNATTHVLIDTLNDVEIFDFSEDLAKLQHSIANKEKVTQEQLINYQNELRIMHQNIKELNSFDIEIEFDAKSEKVVKELVGKIQSRYKTILTHIKAGSCDIKALDFQPSDLCVLPNDLLLVSSHYDSKLAFYNHDFVRVKEVTHLNRQPFRIFSLATCQDRIYLCDAITHLLHMTDMECKELAVVGGKGDEITKLNYPHGICYYDDCIYVCDSGNNRIQVFHSKDLTYANTFKVDFKPWQIKIVKNLACVRSPNPSCIYFLNATDFTLVQKHQGHSGSICVINSQFYEFIHKELKVLCYDANGILNDEASIECLESVWFNGCDGLAYFNSRFLLSSPVTGKLIVF